MFWDLPPSGTRDVVCNRRSLRHMAPILTNPRVWRARQVRRHLPWKPFWDLLHPGLHIGCVACPFNGKSVKYCWPFMEFRAYWPFWGIWACAVVDANSMRTVSHGLRVAVQLSSVYVIIALRRLRGSLAAAPRRCSWVVRWGA